MSQDQRTGKAMGRGDSYRSGGDPSRGIGPGRCYAKSGRRGQATGLRKR